MRDLAPRESRFRQAEFLIELLRRRGCRVLAIGEHLLIGRHSSQPDEIKESIRCLKPELMAVLAQEILT